jgi:GT2 family glycosyltransferase
MPLIFLNQFNMDISIIIVNYNGIEYLDTLFTALLSLKKEKLSTEVIFVDNKSMDDSVLFIEKNYLEKFKGKLKIVKATKNLGFAGGNNLGAEYAAGEYVIFLNNDTKVEPDWMLEMHKCIKKNAAGIINSKLIFYYDFLKIKIATSDKILIDTNIKIDEKNYRLDPKFCKNSVINEKELICFGNTFFYIPIDPSQKKSLKLEIKPNSAPGENDAIFINGKKILLFKYQNGCIKVHLDSEDLKKNINLIQNAGSGVDGNFYGYDIGFCEEDQGQYEEIREINNACGASMIMRKEDFFKVGKFDDNFFMYYEDTDLSYRIRAMGKKLFYCPTAIVRHIHAGSSQEWSPLFIYYVFRNRMFFILKNFSVPRFAKEYLKFIKFVSVHVFFRKMTFEKKLAFIKSILSLTLNAPLLFARKVSK